MFTSDKGVLEKAATSSDPVVRRAAIRRMEINEEIEQLDTFLSFYAQAQREKAAPAVKKAKEPVVEIEAAPKEKKTRSSKGQRVIDAVCAILTKHGMPVALQALFHELQTTHGDVCPPKMESLRPRLHEHHDKIVMVKGRGYWLANTELPPSDAAD